MADKAPKVDAAAERRRKPKRKKSGGGRIAGLVFLALSGLPLLAWLCTLSLQELAPMQSEMPDVAELERSLRAKIAAEMPADEGLDFGDLRLGIETLRDGEGKVSLSDYIDLVQENQLSLTSLFGLQVKTVAIDAGRGGRDIGVEAGDLLEKDVVQDVARRVQELLVLEHGIDAVLTRDGDQKMSVGERLEVARAGRADVMVSLHLGDTRSGELPMARSYYFGFSDQEQVLNEAQSINTGSSLSLGQFKRDFAVFEDTLNARDARMMADIIQSRFVEVVSRSSPRLLDGGTAPAPYTLMLSNDVPTVFVEMSDFSDPTEVERIRSSHYRDTLARGIVAGVVEYLAAQRVLASR